MGDLVNCPTCNGKVSTSAKACPHCGETNIPRYTQAEKNRMLNEYGNKCFSCKYYQESSKLPAFYGFCTDSEEEWRTHKDIGSFRGYELTTEDRKACTHYERSASFSLQFG